MDEEHRKEIEDWVMNLKYRVEHNDTISRDWIVDWLNSILSLLKGKGDGCEVDK